MLRGILCKVKHCAVMWTRVSARFVRDFPSLPVSRSFVVLAMWFYYAKIVLLPLRERVWNTRNCCVSYIHRYSVIENPMFQHDLSFCTITAKSETVHVAFSAVMLLAIFYDR